ncbi:hypothetical protein DPMN_079819 [Dreissena polymorpha]|uniref:Uncharacterized protein n=1 Tax=Dreissena polymorpha TaxID=45954 RepID=A0A9D3YV64_DREPO|nr:hypothetical protein DPMN_079819 [Dreissena polymorpha]
MDPTYEPPETETRTLYGLQLTQKRNDAVINKLVFKNIVTSSSEVRLWWTNGWVGLLNKWQGLVARQIAGPGC